jgi:manganese transport protein
MSLEILTPSRLRSLEDIHSSVPIPATRWKRFLAFAGPALLVSVGYMDPGNWGTDIQAGSKFEYLLIWVLLMSNLMALLLQTLAARLGVVTGRDLAQACRDYYPRPVVFSLWVLTEIAIAATDLAEVIGTIIALKLLFRLPYIWGLVVAMGDTFILLALQRRGVRALEVLTLVLVAVIAGSFLVELFLFPPAWGRLFAGFIPYLAPEDRVKSLYLAVGMLGATVMPHNLYLHSALVQTRAFPQTTDGKRIACKYNFLDSFLALNGAFFVNVFILVLSARIFFPNEIETLTGAHELLHGVWAPVVASGLFAIALLASGQSSTLTGTLSGQIVMEGFLHLRIRPWMRRLLTRSVAIVPAAAVVAWAQHQATSSSPDPLQQGEQVDRALLQLLILSQAVLSFQLPFAIVPLIQFTADSRRMGEFASKMWLKASAWGCAVIVLGLNAFMVWGTATEWGEGLAEQGTNPWWLYGPICGISMALVGLLGQIVIYPRRAQEEELAHERTVLPPVGYHRIGVAVELEGGDNLVLAQAAALARTHHAELFLMHVVEGVSAAYYGRESQAKESRTDRVRMKEMLDGLQEEGLRVTGTLGFGNPPEELVRMVKEHEIDFLVLGTHGHRFFADLAFGQTVSPVLHRLTIPVLVVPSRPAAPAKA